MFSQDKEEARVGKDMEEAITELEYGWVSSVWWALPLKASEKEGSMPLGCCPVSPFFNIMSLITASQPLAA